MPSPETIADRRDPPTTLDALDDALVALRRAQQRPAYRRRLLAGVPRDVELGTIRLLRAVQREHAPTIGQVAETLVIDPSTASRVVDRAAVAGLLERRPCPKDGRRARLHLTPAGDTLLERITAQRRELLAEVTGSWDPDEVAHLVELLGSLVARFDAIETAR